MELKARIREIVDEIRPQFQILGEFGFNGIGEPEEVAQSFIDVYEGFIKAKHLYTTTVGNPPKYACVCQFAVTDVDECEVEAAYSIAKAQGILPPPLMERVFDFTMYMNTFFIAAQKD